MARMNPREGIPTIGIQGKDCVVHGYVVVLGKLTIKTAYFLNNFDDSKIFKLLITWDIVIQ